MLTLVDRLTTQNLSAPKENYLQSTLEPSVTERKGSAEEITNNVQEPWMAEAVKDVAYYLRSHKFNEFDRRYNRIEDDAPQEARKAPLRRIDDTVVVTLEQNWTSASETNSKALNVTNEQCVNLYHKGQKTGKPFYGPLERFQWRTTASYFMCWYTMLEEAALRRIGERCDNYASCLDPTHGVFNWDWRAVDANGEEKPFACAQYSFCPDPCCPRKHYASEKDCWGDDRNPCREANAEAKDVDSKSRCEMPRERNTDFYGVMHNFWNVSCNCSSSSSHYRRLSEEESIVGEEVVPSEGGFVWDSRFGFCVDIDECSTAADTCDRRRESCHNLPGGYACSCSLGHVPSSLRPADMFLKKGKFDLECLRDKRLQTANDIVAAIKKIKAEETSISAGNGAMEGAETKKELLNKEKESRDNGADFETAIGLAGVGKFNYFLMFICGSIFANSAIGIASISFVLPSAQCDFQLNSEDKGRLSASPNIGMLVGCCIWGLIADAKGRKWMIVAGLLLDAICSFASSLAQSYWLFILFRFFNGFGITAASSLVFPYLGEFLPSSKRDRMLCWLELFWSFGVVILPGMAWLVIPQTWTYVSPGGGFTFNSWRLFVALCGVPSVINAGLLCALPETPKFLMSKNKLDEAYMVFQKIHRYNRGKKHEYEVKALQATEEISHPSKNGNVKSVGMSDGAIKDSEMAVQYQKRSRFIRAFQNIISQTKALFKPPHLRSTLITFTVQVGLMSSYYTLILWFPDLFDRFERFQTLYPNRTASICEVTAAVAEQGGVESMPCGSDGEPIVPEKVFINALYVGLACIPTSIWLAVCVDRLGKNIILATSLVTAGACTLGFNFVWNSTQNLILSCIFEALTGMAISALICVVVELFPTNLRAFALSLSLTIGRIGAITGNVAFGWLIDFNCIIPLVVGGVSLIGSGLLCLAIPNVKRNLPM